MASTRWPARVAILSGWTRLLYNHIGPNAPKDLWVYDFADQKSQQITHSLSGGVRSEDMVEPFLVHYPSKDGKWQISAFVYVPYNAQRNGKNAAVVYIHGGPRPNFRTFHPSNSVSGKPGIFGDCAKLSRLNRIRKGISGCQPF